MRFISQIIKIKDPVFITPFGGYANDVRIVCRARVLEDEGIEYQEDDGRLKNIWNSFKRFESDELSGQLVTAEFLGQEMELVSDKEGYIEIDRQFDLGASPKSLQWLPLKLSLRLAGQAPFEIESSVMRPGEDSRVGVISDIDDTVMYTGVSTRFKWRLLVNSIAAHSYERRAFDQAAAFYSALHKGATGDVQNPIFYVSNSPWNLHEYISTFLRHHGFPEGPLLLRDFGIKLGSGGHPFLQSQKYLHIKHILETYALLPFVLIGDAGELDTEIYIHIAKQFPGRITAIYIRGVDSKKQMKRISDLILDNKDLPILLVGNTEEAMEHARISELIVK